MRPCIAVIKMDQHLCWKNHCEWFYCRTGFQTVVGLFFRLFRLTMETSVYVNKPGHLLDIIFNAPCLWLIKASCLRTLPFVIPLIARPFARGIWTDNSSRIIKVFRTFLKSSRFQPLPFEFSFHRSGFKSPCTFGISTETKILWGNMRIKRLFKRVLFEQPLSALEQAHVS